MNAASRLPSPVNTPGAARPTVVAVPKPPAILHTQIDPAVAQLDFERLCWKLSESSESKFTPEECRDAEREYRRFLSLKRWYPNESLVPTKQQDAFWHAHILDTEAYARDCDAVFGRFIHHFPYFGIRGPDDAANMEARFSVTRALYERHFGAAPPAVGARCQDHPCHAPSECACRAPGTCK